MEKKRIFLLFLSVFCLFAIGCSVKSSEKNNQEQVVTLVLASFGEDSLLEQQVIKYNEVHTDYQIKIEQYFRSDIPEEDGISKLQREIASGKGPDIINYGRGYQVTDIFGGYTEDLYPYLEKTGDYCENIYGAFAYQNRLNAMPVDFTLKTYAVANKKINDDKMSWTMEEMISCYERERKNMGNQFMLYPGETKKDVLGSLIVGNIGNFVDWKKGTCNFDSAEFRELLEFSDQFPDSLNLDEDFSPMSSFANGEALLFPVSLQSVYDISKPEWILGEKVSFLGYPTTEVDGTIIRPGTLMFAISVGSKNKEEAWKFIELFLTEEYQEGLVNSFPIRKSILKNKIANAQAIEYTKDTEGNVIQNPKAEIAFEGETPIIIYRITEEQADILNYLVENATISSSYDSSLHTLILEEAEYYFRKEKSLDETVKVIQARALLYISENTKN